MQKKLVIILFMFISIFFICPIESNALSFDSVSNNIYLLEDEENIYLLEDYNNEQECSGENSLLGNPEDPDSVAWLLQQILNYIKIIGPILVVVLSSIDFAGVVVKGDDEAMAKAKKKLITRLILAACLFFIPVITEALLDIFGITSSATCGLK